MGQRYDIKDKYGNIVARAKTDGGATGKIVFRDRYGNVTGSATPAIGWGGVIFAGIIMLGLAALKGSYYVILDALKNPSEDWGFFCLLMSPIPFVIGCYVYSLKKQWGFWLTLLAELGFGVVAPFILAFIIGCFIDQIAASITNLILYTILLASYIVFEIILFIAPCLIFSLISFYIRSKHGIKM